MVFTRLRLGWLPSLYRRSETVVDRACLFPLLACTVLIYRPLRVDLFSRLPSQHHRLLKWPGLGLRSFLSPPRTARMTGRIRGCKLRSELRSNSKRERRTLLPRREGGCATIRGEAKDGRLLG
jgi:hypothetical protein